MDAARLHFPDPGTEPVRLSPGTHAIGWHEGQLGILGTPTQAVFNLQVDARDVWLHVAAKAAACVHVNGRQVHRIALLRAGDVLHVDAAELRLVGAPGSPPPPAAQGQQETAAAQADGPCWVLRGLGGQHHGRCFCLNHPRWVGRSAQADIRIDEDPTVADRHVQLTRIGDQVIVRDLDTPDGSRVNGQPVRDARLRAGDQLLVGHQQRFVLEVPQAVRPALPPPSRITAPPRLPPAPRPRAHWPLWLLLAASAIAAALSGLLLFGKAA